VRFTTRVVASCLFACVASLAGGVPAAAAPTITGKLSKRGYTVIALGATGRATSAQATRGSFRLRPQAAVVTLQLRAPNGTYAGPIVVGGSATRAIVGIRAGARLGKIAIRSHDGYARVSRPLRTGWIDARRWARAVRGRPIGAGRFGFVRSRPSRGTVPGDRDVDGIPDRLDVDDNGNLVLDNFEPGGGTRAAACTPPCAPDVGLASIMTLRIDQTVNANATALTVQDIDSALAGFGYLRIGYPHDATTELDCRGLTYCSSGGTGKVGFTGPGAAVASGASFPECCDADGDGFGSMDRAPFDPGSEGHPGQFFLAHHATTAQIGTGDVLIERATSGGIESQFPITLQDVFATVPALVSYDDGAGNSGTVSYPVAPSTPGCPPPGCPPGGRGTFGNGFPVAAQPNGDVVVTLTFWRPQRKPIPGEPGAWTDIGGLTYTVPRILNPELPGPQQFPGAGTCPQSAFTTTNPNLTPSAVPFSSGGGLKDTAPDQPASAANTISYTLNITQCLAASGVSWSPGHEMQLFFDAGNGYDSVEQTVIFRRQ
jgi:hypothetical protein